MIEDKVTNALDWLRNAKDKFRSFAAGGDRDPSERPAPREPRHGGAPSKFRTSTTVPPGNDTDFDN